jgi:hypothetical protein
MRAANVHDKYPLPDVVHANGQSVHGDSAYASRKDWMVGKAPKAGEFTDQRTHYGAVVDEAVRARNRNKSKIRSRGKHVFDVVKRFWGFCTARYRGLQKNVTRAVTALALAHIEIGGQRLVAQACPWGEKPGRQVSKTAPRGLDLAGICKTSSTCNGINVLPLLAHHSLKLRTQLLRTNLP